MAEPAVVNIESLLSTYPLTTEGIHYVDHVRTNPPNRRAKRGARRNCTVRFASKRMGRVIQAESWTLEGAFLLECEFDLLDTVEFWDQPKAVPIVGTRRDGRTLRSPYTADFLVLKNSGITAIEIKPLNELLSLVEDRPLDWVRSGDSFNYLPAERAFNALGIQYRVIDSSMINQLRAENLRLLLQVRNQVDVTERELLMIVEVVRKHAVLSIQDVCDELQLTNSGPIFTAIESGRIYADIDNQLLTDLASARVADCAESAQLFEGASRLLPKMTGDIGTTTEIPTPSDSIVIMARYNELRGLTPATRSARTLRRYKHALKVANGNLAVLIDHRRQSGNKTPRLSPDHEGQISSSIEQHYKTAASPSIYSAYRMYSSEIRTNPELARLRPPVTYPTYARRVASLQPESTARARGGRRAANAAAAPVDRRQRGFWPSRPFVRNQIDHYLLDVSAVIGRSESKVFAARPWATVIKDDCNGTNVGMALGFLPPSRRACAKALRDCANRWQRLAESIIADGGKEFESIYFQVFTARKGIHQLGKPYEGPRFGADEERGFGSFSAFVCDQLPGNAKAIALGRAVSPTHRGHLNAVLPVNIVWDLAQRFFMQIHNGNPNGRNLDAPVVSMGDALKKFPFSGIPVTCDQEFIIATAIPAPEEKYRVDPARGIRLNGGAWYWAPDLLLLKDGWARDVLIEPWDDGIVYVPVNGRWVTCFLSKTHAAFGLHSSETMLGSICRLEAREALRQMKEHKDDEIGALLRQTFSFIASEPIPTGAHQTAEQSDSSFSYGSIPISDVKPYEMYFGDTL